MSASNNSEESAAKSVFYDIFEPEEARDLEQRAYLLMGIQDHIRNHGLSETEVMTIANLSEADSKHILDGIITELTVDRLVQIAKAFDAEIEIEIKAKFPPVKAASGS